MTITMAAPSRRERISPTTRPAMAPGERPPDVMASTLAGAPVLLVGTVPKRESLVIVLWMVIATILKEKEN